MPDREPQDAFDATIAYTAPRAPGPGDTPAQLGAEASLILIYHPNGNHLGRRYSLRPGTSVEIGRDRGCSISLPDVLGLSRTHGRIHYLPAGVTYEDLGSTNGTFLNDRRVRDRAPLRSGDRLQLGPIHFKFLLEEDIENAYFEALHQLATRDALTELLNKRRFDEELEREFARARRHSRPLALILLDVDHFKEINDRHGHLCGDIVLQRMTRQIRRFIRPEQALARVGGEEFAVLCPETGATGAEVLAEKLRREIAAASFCPPEADGRPVAVTCSFGVAALGGEMAEPSDLFAAADRRLYRAKSGGRDRVCVGEE